jgi:F1F0 ATPase subunit 2
MMTDATLRLALQAAIGFIAGIVVGVPYFASLWWSTRFFVTGSVGKAVALQLGRVGVTIAALTLLARLSFIALLSGVVGLLVARSVLLSRFGELR